MSAVHRQDPFEVPSPEDVRFYREHGYWISPPLLPLELLAIANRGMDRLYRFDVDHEVPLRSDAQPGNYSHWGWRPERGDILRKNDYATLRVEELSSLRQYEAIATCAARLSGASGLRLWHDQLLYKPVDTGNPAANVKWHTDRYYWKTCSSEEMLTAWIPFADVTADDGAMCIVDGSHRWSDQLAVRWDAEDFSIIDNVVSERRAKLVPIVLRAGQISFHHCKAIHGSGANHGSAPRRALAIHFQPIDNRFVKNGSRHPNDDLVGRTGTGEPDYADPRICPVLYP